MTTPTLRAQPVLRAIKCSERMPTREDADNGRGILWYSEHDDWYARGHFEQCPRWATHFYPLTTKPIATDAEEQP